MDRAQAEKLLEAAGWENPAAIFERETWYLWRGNQHLPTVKGRSLRDTLEAAGVHVPAPSQFAAIGSTVVLGEDTVATCRSKTMAARISNALNRYTPNARGV